jgi:DNA-directed RNA polymerase specialized sigma24 family protein
MYETPSFNLGTKLDRGISLSRNFKTRSKEQTSELYILIQNAVLEAQDPQNELADNSLQFIVLVFEPLIKKIATKIYPQVSKHEEFEDILQETYVTFLGLLYAYNPLIASFPYYINKMLPQQVKAWGQKVKKKWSPPVDIVTVDNLLIDPFSNNRDKSYDRYHSYILIQEYETFILERAKKPAKSRGNFCARAN